MSRTIYLIKRGPRPEGHKPPFHPVVICATKAAAKWEAGWSGDRAWVWTREWGSAASGWLLERWEGLDIDYGHVVRGLTLPDGTEAAFAHGREREPWTLLRGAVWWSARRMPAWLEEAGVIYPPDGFTQSRILGRLPRPSCWPEPAPEREVEVCGERRIPNGARVLWSREIGVSPTEGEEAEVVSLTATIAPPNGRWDRYRIRFDDGHELMPTRESLEHWNRDLVQGAEATHGGSDADE